MEGALRGPVPDGLRLIETFGWWPVEGARRLELHLARMAGSANVLGWEFDLETARSAVAVKGAQPARCRLTYDGAAFAVETAPLTPTSGPWRAILADQRLDSSDPWLAHKTSRRAVYDRARAALPDGVDEAILLNERGELCEGTITNLFVTKSDGRVLTPAKHCGLLPGILRQELLAARAIEEAVLTVDDLRTAKRVEIGNSLRGRIDVELLN